LVVVSMSSLRILAVIPSTPPGFPFLRFFNTLKISSFLMGPASITSIVFHIGSGMSVSGLFKNLYKKSLMMPEG
jgi:hypothetical protein